VKPFRAPLADTLVGTVGDRRFVDDLMTIFAKSCGFSAYRLDALRSRAQAFVLRRGTRLRGHPRSRDEEEGVTLATCRRSHDGISAVFGWVVSCTSKVTHGQHSEIRWIFSNPEEEPCADV
jgi:hypothetical protein